MRRAFPTPLHRSRPCRPPPTAASSSRLRPRRRRAAAPGRPATGPRRRREARPEPRPPRLRHRAAGPPARRHPPRQAARRGRRRGSRRGSATRTCWRRCCWPGCGTSSRGRTSGSSSTPCWWSTRPTRRAWPGRTRERWLPIFWAIDNFKSAQAQNAQGERLADEAGGRDEAAAGPQGRRRRSPRRWTTGTRKRPTRRSPRWPGRAGANELFELFARYGCRDFRDIGHKAIYVAERLPHPAGDRLAPRRAGAAVAGLRAAQPRGRQPGEARRRPRPPRPARTRSWPKRIRADWVGGKADPEATADLWPRSATAASADAAEKVAKLLNAGVSPRSVWDGLFLGGRRAADAAAGDRRAAHPDDDERPALRLRRLAATTRPRRLLMLQGGVVPAAVPRGDDRPRQGRATPGSTSWSRPSKPERRGRGLRRAVAGQGVGGADGAGLPEGGRAGRQGADRRRPAAGVPEGDGLARLQVQLGGDGGLRQRVAARGATGSWPRACTG